MNNWNAKCSGYLLITYKRSFISAFSICTTVPLMGATLKYNSVKLKTINRKKLFEEETKLIEEDIKLEITEQTGLLLEEIDNL